MSPRPSLALTPQVEVAPRLVTSTKVSALLVEAELVQTKLQQLKAKKEKIDEDLAKLHTKYGKKFEDEELIANQVSSHNVSIDKKVLVECGVKASVILKATRNTPYSYTLISRRKKDEGEAL